MSKRVYQNDQEHRHTVVTFVTILLSSSYSSLISIYALYKYTSSEHALAFPCCLFPYHEKLERIWFLLIFITTDVTKLSPISSPQIIYPLSVLCKDQTQIFMIKLLPFPVNWKKIYLGEGSLYNLEMKKTKEMFIVFQMEWGVKKTVWKCEHLKARSDYLYLSGKNSVPSDWWQQSQ